VSVLAENLKTQDQSEENEFLQKIKVLEFSHFKDEVLKTMDSIFTSDELAMQVMSIGDQVSTFVRAMGRLFSDRKDDIGAMIFNKDDDLIVEFVSAATNIRAYNFSIPLEVKTKRLYLLFLESI